MRVFEFSVVSTKDTKVPDYLVSQLAMLGFQKHMLDPSTAEACHNMAASA